MKSKKSQKPLSRKQAAELLGVSIGTIDNYLRDGKLRKAKFGEGKNSTVRIPRESIEELLINNQ